MIKNLISAFFLLLLIAATLTAQKDDTSTWMHSDGATELSVKRRNSVRFNDDYTDVASISGDGFLEVLERRNGLTRRIRFTAGSNGQLVRTYSVNGETRAFDEEGKKWLAKMLNEAAGKGFDAPARAAQIIRQRGAAALLSEISRLSGDYPKRIYLEEAVKSGSLDADAFQQVFKLANAISSDYEKATLLIGAAKSSSINRNTQDAYFATLATVKSDYEHGRVLEAVLKADSSNKEIMKLSLASAAKIGSEYERANVLIRIARTNVRDERLRAELLNVTKTIASEHERGRVLNAIYLNESK